MGVPRQETKSDRTARELLREARRRRKLSQRDLAAAAGVPQSLIAKIESGAQQPSFPTLARLIDAAGFSIKSELSNTVRPSRLVATHRAQLHELGASYGIARIRVFGSVARGTDNSDSDLDLLVDLDPTAHPLKHLGFEEAAAQLLECRVDVVTTDSLHDLMRDTVLAEARDLDSL